MTTAQTRLGFTRDGIVLLYVAGTMGGVSLGIALPWLARWIGSWQWAPAQGLFSFVASADQLWIVGVLPVFGAVLGTAFAWYVNYQSPVVLISDESLRITQNGDTRVIPRRDVVGVHRAKRKTVIELTEGRKPFEGEVDGSLETIKAAFTSHGYPWEMK